MGVFAMVLEIQQEKSKKAKPKNCFGSEAR
jgi:hypothetical protein